MCSPGWPLAYRSPASSSQMLELQAYTTKLVVCSLGDRLNNDNNPEAQILTPTLRVIYTTGSRFPSRKIYVSPHSLPLR